MIKQTLLQVYDKHYKKLMVFSFVLLFLCIGYLGYTYATTGEFFQKSVSLKGGITITAPIENPVEIHAFESNIQQKYPDADISVREITERGVQKAIIIEAADVTSEELIAEMELAGINTDSASVENIGSALGKQFFSQTLKALILAFIAVGIVVFITFRSIIPSLFVVLAVISDIISTLAVLNILDVKIGIAGVAAFLMFIGFSVDTDILLTTKVLKRKGEGGTVFERTILALKTGVVLTIAGLTPAVIGLIFFQSDVIRQILTVITIGLIFDLIYTWFQNAGILRYYLERQNGKN